MAQSVRTSILLADVRLLQNDLSQLKYLQAQGQGAVRKEDPQRQPVAYRQWSEFPHRRPNTRTGTLYLLLEFEREVGPTKEEN